MKKALSLLLALVMALSLTACSINIDGKHESDAPSDAQPQEPAVPAEPEATGEPVQGAEPAVPAPEKPGGAAGDAKDGEPDAGYVIYASHTDVTLKSAGETFRFTVWDSRGSDPDACTYTSADPAVASVDETGGEVTAVAPGTTTVTAHVEFGGERQDFDCIVRCQWTEESGTASGTAAAPSLSDFFAALQGKYEGLGSMMVLEGELLENYYPGLSDIASVEEIYIQETMISISNVAVGLVKLSADASPDDVTAVRNILQARINAQADGGAWYPASCETWKQGVIASSSNVVGMFVYPGEAQAMADLFTESFGN